MNIFLTIDVECYSGDYEAEVYGGGLGLPFILDVCRQHGMRATFFVEALGATRWGDAGVRRICQDLKAHQQDIQLHIHPSVADELKKGLNMDMQDKQDKQINRASSKSSCPSMLNPSSFDQGSSLADCCDTFSALDGAMQEHLLRVGRTILEGCGAPTISAFRAGDLAANDVTLLAMERAGIKIGSNRDLDGKCSIRSELNHAFPVVNDISVLNGQIDLPVTVMRSPFPFLDGKVRHFEISALGAAEMRDGLRRLKKAGYATATILTHPGEFFRNVNGRYVPIQKNCRRWESLLKFLAIEPGIEVNCVGECADISFPERSPVIPRFNPVFSLLRVIEQVRQRIWARRHGVRP